MITEQKTKEMEEAKRWTVEELLACPQCVVNYHKILRYVEAIEKQYNTIVSKHLETIPIWPGRAVHQGYGENHRLIYWFPLLCIPRDANIENLIGENIVEKILENFGPLREYITIEFGKSIFDERCSLYIYASLDVDEYLQHVRNN